MSGRHKRVGVKPYNGESVTSRKHAFCLTTLSTVVGFAACTYEIIDYEYISLSESMTAIVYNEPNVLGVFEHEEMPTSYVLERRDYIIYADVDVTANRPTIILSIEGKDQKEIGFNVDSFDSIGCFLYSDDISPTEFESHRYRAGSIRLKWASGRKPPPCEEASLPSDQDRKITLSIFDSSAGKIAQEELRFDIVKNGRRRIYDTL